MSRTLPIEELLGEAVWLRRLAASLVSDAALADDLVQDTWVSALRSPPTATGDARPWLARVVRNLASNARRSRGRREARESTVRREDVVPGSDDLAQHAEVQRLVAEAVTRLPDPLRDAVVLRYFQGLDSTVAAQRLGVPPSTLRTRLQRAIETLREDLDRRVDGGRAAWAVLMGPLAGSRPTLAATTAIASSPSLVSGWTAWMLATATAGIVLALTFRGLVPEEEQALVTHGGESVSAPREMGETPLSSAVVSGQNPLAARSQRIPAAAVVEEETASHPDPVEGVVSGTILVDGHVPEWSIFVRLEETPAPTGVDGLKRRVPPPSVVRVRPEDEGRFRFSGLSPSWRGRLTVGPDRFVDDHEEIALEAPRSDLELSLVQSPALVGRLVDPHGGSFADFEAHYAVHGGEVDPSVTVEIEGAPDLESDGRFRVPIPIECEDGWCTAEVVFRGPTGFARGEIGHVPFRPLLNLGDLVLEPVRTLHFDVRDPAGRPIEGAVASLVTTLPQDLRAGAETAADGAGLLPAVPERAFDVDVRALGYENTRVSCDAGESPVVQMQPLSTLRVHGSFTPGDALVLAGSEPVFVWNSDRRDEQMEQVLLGAARFTRTTGKSPRHPLWEYELSPDREFEDGSVLLVGLAPDVPFSIDLRDSKGQVLASRTLSVGRGERVALVLDVQREPSAGLLRKKADLERRSAR